MYMLTNGIQQTEDFNDYKSNHFTAIIKPVPALTWTTSYYFGQEQQQTADEADGPDGFFTVFDTYAAYTLDDRSSRSASTSTTSRTGSRRTIRRAICFGLGAYATLSGDARRPRSRFATSGSMTTAGCSAGSISFCRKSR